MTPTHPHSATRPFRNRRFGNRLHSLSPMWRLLIPDCSNAFHTGAAARNNNNRAFIDRRIGVSAGTRWAQFTRAAFRTRPRTCASDSKGCLRLRTASSCFSIRPWIILSSDSCLTICLAAAS